MEAEMLKGHLDAIVLAALEAGPAHGYAIIETIKRGSASTFDLPEGTVYPALHRLEQGGLLSSAWVTPTGGRRRRMYSLTKAGSAALVERRKAWGRFSTAVHTLLQGGGRTWPA
jgi:PadR family transcriptional regulator PadR